MGRRKIKDHCAKEKERKGGSLKKRRRARTNKRQFRGRIEEQMAVGWNNSAGGI